MSGDLEGGHTWAFHTKAEKDAHIIIDLKRTATVNALRILNRTDSLQDRARTLCLWTSADGENRDRCWKAPEVDRAYKVILQKERMGARVMGVTVRYLKLGLQSETPEYLHLYRVRIYGK